MICSFREEVLNLCPLLPNMGWHWKTDNINLVACSHKESVKGNRKSDEGLLCSVYEARQQISYSADFFVRPWARMCVLCEATTLSSLHWTDLQNTKSNIATQVMGNVTWPIFNKFPIGYAMMTQFLSDWKMLITQTFLLQKERMFMFLSLLLSFPAVNNKRSERTQSTGTVRWKTKTMKLGLSRISPEFSDPGLKNAVSTTISKDLCTYTRRSIPIEKQCCVVRVRNLSSLIYMSSIAPTLFARTLEFFAKNDVTSAQNRTRVSLRNGMQTMHSWKNIPARNLYSYCCVFFNIPGLWSPLFSSVLLITPKQLPGNPAQLPGCISSMTEEISKKPVSHTCACISSSGLQW